MASDGKKSDDMDSLFDGMVLFNPAADIEIGVEAEVQQDNYNGSDALTTSQPLDENLFSDLTLVVDPLQNSLAAEADHDLQSQHQLSVSATAPTSSSSSTQGQGQSPSQGQPPRRRKRSGLRIGYGRDTLHFNDMPHTLYPLPQPIYDSESLGAAHTVRLPETLPSIITATDDADADAVTLSVPSTESSSKSDNENREYQHASAFSGEEPSAESSSKSENENRKQHRVSVFPEEEPSAESSSISGNDNLNQQHASAFPEAEFEQIKATIREKLNLASQLVKNASSARKDSIRNRRKIVENANLASLRYMELEKQLEEACEAEDFERAEKVSEKLSVAEKEKLTYINSLREADAFVDALDLKLQHTLESQLVAEEQCAILLDHYAKNALNNADSILKKATSVFSKEMDQWLSSSEAMEVKKMELEIEAQFMNEARLELNNSIEHSIQDDKREKEILCKRKDVLMGELDQLLALVKQKEKEIADNDSNLEAVENKINKVLSGFEEMKLSINVKYDKLQSALAHVKLETETLTLKKGEIDNSLTQEEEMGARLRNFASISSEEAEGYRETVKLRRNLMSSILKSRGDKLTLAENEEKLSGDVKLFQEEVSAARTSLQELSSRKSSIQQEIASFKQRIIFIDKRVPELEAEKKVATAARNFKEAARIATEAKSLCVEKESIQIDMDKFTLNLEKLEEEIKETLNKLQETEGVILLKEKELAMVRYQKLRLASATARAEKAGALKMGDIEEANLLTTEAEAADREAEKLQSTYKIEAKDLVDLGRHLISMDHVSYLDQKQLGELGLSLHL
ncbi:hypothetical protein LR48_Vigan303s007300 [Vigna angularis]|uniref:UVR domain-containing protein n=1 Tax=Phaseolus angularis TaxID=3914 RepID=A0A0L9T8G6_PHAAN|nr:hypothetical protein LR48_Vigan303s007300 [Vigna angularis]